MENYRGMAIPTTLEQVCDPQRMALLVYDMQVGVLGQIDDSAGVITRVATVLDAARSAGVRTFFTRHMTLPLEVTGTSGLRTAMTWQRTSNVDEVISAFPRDSPQFQIIPEVTPLAGEAVLDKIAMSAFAGTPLDFALRDCGIEAFAIVGVALEVGIEPTVRHSLDLGYLPVVVVDACGYGNHEAAQRSLAQLAFFGGSLQTDTATLCTLLNP
ncbi:MAG TPA: cysteine hydrolase [Pseudonocardiaceae bacterium]|jgi:nicotinamidase-related amidase|nr:cysteine hydrolase [Pseudonocardiaceae bacterium]